MRSVTELMERAARYRQMARSEPDPRVQAMLLQVSRDYDARVCARLRMVKDEWGDISPRELSPPPSFVDMRGRRPR